MFDRAAHFLKDLRKICIASHYGPDADAIGSSVALGLGLMELGKKVVIYNKDRVPDNLAFLPFTDRISQNIDQAEAFDALIMVDVAKPRRSGEPIESIAANTPVFIIDHHVLPQLDPNKHCISTEAAATGELIYGVLRTLGCTITPDIATLLYAALVGDTGGFSYSSTTPRVFRLAAELVEAGASPWHVASSLNEQNPPSTFRLLRLMLDTVQRFEQGKLAICVLTQDMLAEADALPEQAEEFVNYPRSIAGVEVAAFFRELPDGRWKVSLRSKRYVDVAAIASLFDGGGHQHAAGCTLDCKLPEAKELIFAKIHESLSRRPVLAGKVVGGNN